MPRVKRKPLTRTGYTERHVQALLHGDLAPAFGVANPPLSDDLYPPATLAAARAAWPILRESVEAAVTEWNSARSMVACRDEGATIRSWAWHNLEPNIDHDVEDLSAGDSPAGAFYDTPELGDRWWGEARYLLHYCPDELSVEERQLLSENMTPEASACHE